MVEGLGFSGFFAVMAILSELAVRRYLEERFDKVRYQHHLDNVVTCYKHTCVVSGFVVKGGDRVFVADAKYRDVDKIGLDVIYQIVFYALTTGSTGARICYPGRGNLTHVNIDGKRGVLKWTGLSLRGL